MAKKSKTQRAKASAARAAKKEQETNQPAESAVQTAVEEPKRKLFRSSDSASETVEKKPVKKEEKKSEPVKKKRFAFLHDVRAELKRVTWPTRQDVLRWSLVVVAALVFFGLYTFLLDSYVITPLLYVISGLGA